MKLVEYKEYLEKRNFANSNKSRYFVNWVKAFLRLELPGSLSNQEKIKQFSESLAVNEVKLLLLRRRRNNHTAFLSCRDNVP